MTDNQIVKQEEGSEWTKNRTGLAKVKAYAEIEEVKQRFINLLGDREGRAYVESIVIAVAHKEELQQCSPKSIMISAMRAASLKLSVDPIMKQEIGRAHV